MFGLGTTWTSFHLFYEQEAANMLNIPYPSILAGKSAYTLIGTYQDPSAGSKKMKWNNSIP
jgi:hypothetical protein